MPSGSKCRSRRSWSKPDAEHARVHEAISELQAASVALQEGVAGAAGQRGEEFFHVIVVMSLVGLFALGAGLALGVGRVAGASGD